VYFKLIVVIFSQNSFSATSPSPEQRRERNEGSAFQRRIPRMSYNGDQPLPPTMLSHNGNFGVRVLAIPQPALGQSGRRKPPKRKDPATHTVFLWGSATPDNSAHSTCENGHGNSCQTHPMPTYICKLIRPNKIGLTNIHHNSNNFYYYKYLYYIKEKYSNLNLRIF
jgi:hypothetical protein